MEVCTIPISFLQKWGYVLVAGSTYVRLCQNMRLARFLQSKFPKDSLLTI
jgi:hypothetical protein